MSQTSDDIQKIYLGLILLNTVAASFIWGINTLFLLDAGLTNAEAFAANAFFTVGQVLFEIPTGLVADTWGRRTSYILGTFALAATTLLYLFAWVFKAPFFFWGLTSIFLGLGFTFFSGATEAWLVDALTFTGYKGDLESVFGKGQIVSGIAMLVGSVSGGLIAQITNNLGIPYVIRASVLTFTCIFAYKYMKDIGFTPVRTKTPVNDIRKLLQSSVQHSFRNKEVRWLILEAPLSVGVSFYTFYAMQPHLLTLYGNSQAYGVAGLAAAIVAGAQIFGGFLVPHFRHFFKKRTSVLIFSVLVNSVVLLMLSQTSNFFIAIGLFVIWALFFAMRMPIRQAYMNQLIPSDHRATVLSFDSLIGSSGGVVIQPVLGKVVDVTTYPLSYIGAGLFQSIALPFVFFAQRQKSKADDIVDAANKN